MKKQSSKRVAVVDPKRPAAPKSATNAPKLEAQVGLRPAKSWWLAVAGTLAVVGLWSYWPTISDLVTIWSTQPDYSHGFFVIPLAGYFLWARRSAMPGDAGVMHGPLPRMLGLGVLGLSVFMRWQGALYAYDSLDGWSLALWLAGVCLLLGGSAFLRWCLPSLLFLLFMVPLPYRLEIAMGIPLQKVATKGSCWLLQSLGQPALAEGNVILLGDQRLEVSQACGGLRMFMGITALAFVYTVLTRRAWWEKAILAAGVVPIALLANVLRITATGILYEHISGEWAKKLVHDGAGLITILLAAAMFGLLLWYLRHLVREVQVLDRRDLIRTRGIA